MSKFSFYNPMYVIGGDDDLKLQLSMKYRMAKAVNLYFAYTQLMFWNIYDESKPFADINYSPELFYRWFEKEDEKLFSLDTGYLHTSNGKDGIESRSMNRLFVRTNLAAKIERNYVGIRLMLYEIYDEDETNKDITEYMGYYNLAFYVSDIIVQDKGHLDLEFVTFAGDQLINFDKGGYQIGLTYNFESEDFNPSIYFQRYEGFAENLARYNVRRTEHRIGLMMSF